MGSIFELKVGDKVLLKTKEQLLEDGWYEDEVYDSEGSLRIRDWDNAILRDMFKYLGMVVTISDVWDDEFEVDDDVSYTWHNTCINMLETLDLERVVKQIRKEINEK